MEIIVETQNGNIKGIEEDKLRSFLGIRYAKPPVGDLRFRPPLPIDKWEGIVDALEYSPICPQPPDGTPIEAPRDEDCLSLNIYAPVSDGKPKPVMFWVHGGAFSMGSGSRPRFYGGNLAQHGDVVVVTINYRLGPFGFLSLPGITPNLGILDQIAALKWVNENISAFNGDPNNITIFGVSAGGASVTILLTNPKTKGLFHKAIIQSGTARRHQLILEKNQMYSNELLSVLKIEKDDIDTLWDISTEDLLNVQKDFLTKYKNLGIFGPVIDGEIIPQHPLDAIRKGEVQNIPLMIGHTKDEIPLYAFSLMTADDKKIEQAINTIRVTLQKERVPKSNIDEMLKAYKSEISKAFPAESPYKYLDMIITDNNFRIPSIRVADAQSQHQSNTFYYIFAFSSSPTGLAPHTMELPFVFNTLDTKDFFAGFISDGETERNLSIKVMDIWTSFAKTGDPNNSNIPVWKKYTSEKRTVMFINEKMELKNEYLDELVQFWDGIL